MSRTYQAKTIFGPRNEHTVATTCKVGGKGYWTGQDVQVLIHPADAGTGVRLVRSDRPQSDSTGQAKIDLARRGGTSALAGPSCQAVVTHRQDAAMRTNLVCGDAKFQMVEHLMAALVAMEIDNCVVEIDGEEFPSLDGSSQAYVDALFHAGLIIQAMPRKCLVIDQRYRVGSADQWVEAAPPLRGESFYKYQLRYDDVAAIPRQSYCLELTPDRFVREVASARTFVTQTQADQIRAAGLAQHVTNEDLLVIGPSGPIDNQYRYDNECARHKTLDLIGDLSLAGVELVGRFTSFRGGHSLNGAMASLLFDLAAEQHPAARETGPPRNVRPSNVQPSNLQSSQGHDHEVTEPTTDQAPAASASRRRDHQTLRAQSSIRRYVQDPVTQGFRRSA